MGIKSRIKEWASFKLKNLIDYEKLPIRIVSNRNIEVGKDSFHNGKFEVRGSKKIRIGAFCAFGRDIKIITTNHNYNLPVMQYGFYNKYFGGLPIKKNELEKEFSVEIGNDVWLGDNVCILPNVNIGNGVVVGTGSIVTKDVPDYTIVAGVPAKFIKNRFSNTIKEELLASQWWNWSDDDIMNRKDFFFKEL